ncbi:MAG: AAA family ATPase [Candidatus Marinimicrobia bacterium]|nr:AAA family ATPase [Candidatus Neomarinimicrobiota bacterium]
MITRINLIRNVTQFDSVQPARDIDFKRLTLIYAENGRGKTSLSAIFRSLVSGDPLPIQERSRLGATHPPHVVLQTDLPAGQFLFQNNSWNQSYPALSIFDDIFVVDNVYSGLEIQANHRQNLHEFILGSRGIALARRVEYLATQISEINNQILQASDSIPPALRGQLTIDQFCEINPSPNIDQEIQDVERQIAALSHASEIDRTAIFQQFSLPQIDLNRIQIILSSSLQDIDQASLSRVTEHFAKIGVHGEQWIADGLSREIPATVTSPASCPYCAQDLIRSHIVAHYRTYFSQEYANLKRTISDSQSSLSSALSGDSLAALLRQLQDVQNKSRFWNQFTHVPELTLDFQVLQSYWQVARDTLLNALTMKSTSPLESLELTQDTISTVNHYTQLLQQVSALSEQFQTANNEVLEIKRATAQANLPALNNRLSVLRITKIRFQSDVVPLCDTYLRLKQEKLRLEGLKVEAREALDNYRDAVFPNFQTSINTFLARFNAGFEIVNVHPYNAAGRPSSIYQIRINNINVDLTGAPGEPSFRNTLSGGDRNSLALAFFLASLDQEPDVAEKVVVLDDVVASLDEHRKLVTAEEIRRLQQRVSQVIVLSHNKSFLCEIWNTLHSPNVSTIHIAPVLNGSNIIPWDPTADSLTNQDRSIATLSEYRNSNQGNPRHVAESLRYALEGYIRAKFPLYFPPGSLLGSFVNLCRQRIGQADEILNLVKTDELEPLVHYANRFHHGNNPNWQTEVPTDGELCGFVRRTLGFIQG